LKTVTASPKETGSSLIRVEVVYALPQRQTIVTLDVRPGCTATQAVALSGIEKNISGLDRESLELGIFSRPLNGKDLALPHEYELKDGDRIEIYRPLLVDPKQARLERARKNQTGK
jgi:hypothetical protein